MVKDGWSFYEQIPESSYKTNIYNGNGSPSSTDGSNQYTSLAHTATQGHENVKDVWGVYESKEKLMEMHIC